MKLKKVLLVIMLLLLSTSVFACKQQPTISWTKVQISLELGDEKQLNELVLLENAEFSDIIFSSLNQNIVVVQDEKIVAVGAGNALVEARIDDRYSYITVSVSKAQEKFALFCSFFILQTEPAWLPWRRPAPLFSCWSRCLGPRPGR